MQRNSSIDLLTRSENILQRLNAQKVPMRHTRLYGWQILGNEGWMPFTDENALKLLRELEPPSKLDIANARWRE